jgi:hypothetical protein
MGWYLMSTPIDQRAGLTTLDEASRRLLVDALMRLGGWLAGAEAHLLSLIAIW